MKTIKTGLVITLCLAVCGTLYAVEQKAPAPAAPKPAADAATQAPPAGEFLDEKVEYAGDFQGPAGKGEEPYIGLVPGYRGTAIPASGSQLLFVKKGDRVDVLVTFEAATKEAKEKMTATILQNVIVINVQKPERVEGMGVIELLCNPNEAQYLALSVDQGDTSLAVRAPGDVEMHPMEMASFRKLIK